MLLFHVKSLFVKPKDAQKRLIEKTKKEDGELVVVRDGKVVRIKARDLK